MKHLAVAAEDAVRNELLVAGIGLDLIARPIGRVVRIEERFEVRLGLRQEPLKVAQLVKEQRGDAEHALCGCLADRHVRASFQGRVFRDSVPARGPSSSAILAAGSDARMSVSPTRIARTPAACSRATSAPVRMPLSLTRIILSAARGASCTVCSKSVTNVRRL